MLPKVFGHSKGTTVPGRAADLGSLFLRYHLWLVTPGAVAGGEDISLPSGLLEHLVRVWFSSWKLEDLLSLCLRLHREAKASC